MFNKINYQGQAGGPAENQIITFKSSPTFLIKETMYISRQFFTPVVLFYYTEIIRDFPQCSQALLITPNRKEENTPPFLPFHHSSYALQSVAYD